MVRRSKPGVRCGYCESPFTQVVLTRKGNQHVERTRKCIKCSHRFKTVEINQKLITTDPKFDVLWVNNA